MTDIINFPSWIFEKEQELKRMEFQLAMQYQIVEEETQKLAHERKFKRSAQFISFAMGFCSGIGIMFLLVSANL